MDAPLPIIVGLIKIELVLTPRVPVDVTVFGVLKGPLIKSAPVLNTATFEDPATLTVTLAPELAILTLEVPLTMAFGVPPAEIPVN